jgi:hypothetical protein
MFISLRGEHSPFSYFAQIGPFIFIQVSSGSLATVTDYLGGGAHSPALPHLNIEV